MRLNPVGAKFIKLNRCGGELGGGEHVFGIQCTQEKQWESPLQKFSVPQKSLAKDLLKEHNIMMEFDTRVTLHYYSYGFVSYRFVPMKYL